MLGKRLLAIAGGVLVPFSLAVVCAITFSPKNGFEPKNAYADIQEGSITFSRATAETHEVKSNDYYYTSGKTANGTNMYVFNASNVSLSTSYVAVMCSSFDAGSVTPELRFTSEINGKNPSNFGFQSISSISMTSTSANNRSLSR